MNKILLSIIGLLLVFNLFGQSYRTFDGSNNNTNNSIIGSVNSPYSRLAAAEFNDGMSEPAGINRPNPRELSIDNFWEKMNAEEQDLNLSTFVWVWGKFIDHDINSTRTNTSEPFPIEISLEDPYLSELAALGKDIEMYRIEALEGTGNHPENPRRYANHTSTWIDGSMIYGHDQYRADWLRTFFRGKMKTSEGNLLPFNTKSGNFNDIIDFTAPSMVNPRNASKYFVTGDVKANETLQLLSLHTLFIREHNRLCDSLVALYPYWSDEKLYFHARALVGGMIQKITFDEWLPALGIYLDEFQGYNDELDPSINEFYALAGGNIGHSMLQMSTPRIDEYGNVNQQGKLTYQHGFYNPVELPLSGGLDDIFRGMAVQEQAKVNCYVPLEMRNFNMPWGEDEKYTDFWAVAVNRGRDVGLANFNSARAALGLSKLTAFSEISINQELSGFLEDSYSNIDDVDLWVGMLAENHIENSAFGSTLHAIYKNQFQNLRDGDRYYYIVDLNLTETDIELIENSTLANLILKNTDIETIQKNVFISTPINEWPRNQYSISQATFDAVAFPIPTSQELTIVINATANDELATVELLNANGSIIQNIFYDLQDGKNIFELNNLNWSSPGIYFLRVGNSASSKILKIVKSQ